MELMHPFRTYPALTTQEPLPKDVVPGGEWVVPLVGDQAQPVCFGVGQLRIPERPKNERLCSACMSLSRLESTQWEEINNFRKVVVDHHHSFNALLKNALEGCHLCGLFLIALEERCRLDQEPGGVWVGKAQDNSVSLNDGIKLGLERVKSTIRLTRVVVDEVQITILCGNLPSSMCGRLICKTMDTSLRGLPETCLPSGSDTNTGSSASMSRIKTWLDICTSSHPSCSQSGSQPPALPTRVIAVGSRESSKCYLVSGDKKSGYYATLSHCWGDPHNRPLLTTDQTLACRQQGIEDDTLPKTFRDAVQVCREIGIEYIWIDSLCIIQGQETQEDWAKEAPRMGLVYGNSRLNISATAAGDSTQGCFKDRLGLTSWPCPFVLFGQACYLFRFPTPEEEIRGDPGDARWDDQNFLARRAWVLQEQVLPRRSIIFSKTRLIWRCPTLSTNEKYPLGMPRAPMASIDNSRFLHCMLNRLTFSMPKGPVIDGYTCWYRLVEEFTSRNLTYEEDRLPAIAGMAKRFGEAENDSYHAGLWRNDIIFGLLWRASVDVTRKARSARAPSWSWASIHGAVNYSDPMASRHHRSLAPMPPLIGILDVSDPITCAEHPFGVTSRASLTLSGVLLVVVQNEHEDSGLALVENGTLHVDDISHIYPDVHYSSRPDRLVYLPVYVRRDSEHRDIENISELYTASWTKSLETGIDEFDGFSTLYCLILQAIEGDQDTYSRVGLCTLKEHKTIEISRMALYGERRSIAMV